MNFQRYILLALSKKNKNEECESGITEWSIENALSLLENVYPNFVALVSGKRIVDFGCGYGYQSLALVKKYNCSVVGIETNTKTLDGAIEHTKSYDFNKSELTFVNEISNDMIGNFDIVISQNSFEHFSVPDKVIKTMLSLLNPSGTLLISFGPPWFAPYGSHMRFFCKLPWLNVFFSEKVIMSVRKCYRNDGAIRYQDVESGLNKMTISKFESIIKANRLNVLFSNYKTVKGIPCLAKIPFFREFFINQVTVLLSKSSS